MNFLCASRVVTICTTSMFLSAFSDPGKPAGTTLDLTPWLRVQTEYKSFVAQKFAEFRIVPDMIIKAPDELCNVTYPSGVVVQIGEKLNKDQIKKEPDVTWSCDRDTLYALFMQNIDDLEWDSTDSWVILNIKGCNYFEGTDIFDYKEQCPDIEHDEYRIVFLIYKQPVWIDYFDLEYNQDANPFIEIQAFADRNNLVGPIAGNFFVANDLNRRKRVKW